MICLARKRSKIFSTGNNKFDENSQGKDRGVALSQEEVACLNWFIKNIKIEDY